MDLNLQTISLKSNRLFIKIASVVLAAASFLSGVTPSFAAELAPSAEIDWSDAPVVEGTSAIMMDAGSGEILYEKNPHERREPASITKIMTCLVVLETMELDQKLTVDYDIANEESNMELSRGETLTVEQLLYGLMLWSANDAAEFLAISVGGSIENFADMMNERAVRCGAVNTHFNNPNGLNDSRNKTTAYDLAMICREAMKNPDFRKIVSTKSYTIPANAHSEARRMKNTNPCLGGTKAKVEIDGVERPFTYEGNMGIKTGWTTPAGECFCGWTQQGDTELVTVVLNSSTKESKFVDSIKLWDYGFEKYDTYTVASAVEPVAEIRVKRSKERRINASVAEDLDVTLNAGYDSKNITTEVKDLEEKPRAPLKKGDKVAYLQVYKEGKLVAEEPLVAMADVEEGGIFSWIVLPDRKTMGVIAGILVALILLMLIRMLYVRTRRRRRLRRRAKRGRKVRRKEREREKTPFATVDNFKDFKDFRSPKELESFKDFKR